MNSYLYITDHPPIVDKLYDIGASISQKQAAYEDYRMTGILQLNSSGWIVLSVPNALVRGVLSALHEPGLELPPYTEVEKFSAGIPVISPEELNRIGGPKKIKERGRPYTYNLGRLVSISPTGIKGVRKIWALVVHSKELQDLRRSYNLPPFPDRGMFKIICGVVRSKSG